MSAAAGPMPGPEALEGRTVEVRVPATSANLGPGFDTLGLALSMYDELEVTALEPGVYEIEVSGSGAEEIARDASNLVVRSIAHVFADAGVAMPGIRLVARNGVPHGRGLGSSGAAVAAGVLAAQGLLEGFVELDDAALAAGRMLCSYGDLSRVDRWRAAIYGYNHVDSYVDAVASAANAIAAGAR